MKKIDILYQDTDFIICIKPPRILSTDEPGGLPDLLRTQLNNANADIRTVHRLDRVVSGLMVLACSKKSASMISSQIRSSEFQKEYLAVIHGQPSEQAGILEDLLLRNKPERKTYVVTTPGKDVQKAILSYKVEKSTSDMSLVSIKLITGRTHQIRCQFASRNLPIVGDRKYSLLNDPCEIALWSHSVSFNNPSTNKPLHFTAEPPNEYPWNIFQEE